MASETNTVEFQRSLVLQAWRCLIGDASVTYVSGPITTGLRWIEALEAGKDPGEPVIKANCDAIRFAARELRRRAPGLVLEPASLHVEGWSQEDYLTLWTTLIERHASAVIFVDGWSYSIGCAQEFERAVSHQIATLTFDEQPIIPRAGAMMIRQASENVATRSATASKAAVLSQRLAEVASRLEAMVTDDQQIGTRSTR